MCSAPVGKVFRPIFNRKGSAFVVVGNREKYSFNEAFMSFSVTVTTAMTQQYFFLDPSCDLSVIKAKAHCSSPYIPGRVITGTGS